MATPVLDISEEDFFSDEVLLDPYPYYSALRNRAPAVHLACHDVWAVARYADARNVLRDWRSFSSAHGTAMDPGVNSLRAGNIISTDPPEHDKLRGVLGPQMSAKAMKKLQTSIEQRADAVVADLAERGRADVVTELAQPFPLGVVADLVGFPAEGREGLLEWVDASFNTFGPMNKRTKDSIPKLKGIWSYLDTAATREHLTPGGLGMAIYEAADRGDITPGQCRPLLFAYATAGIDTTVNALSSAVWLFAQHPDQWELLRRDPALVPSAFNEVLRLESPIQAFTRRAQQDCEVDGMAVPEGARVLVLYGSANRDERKWADPERFDVTRQAADNLSFSYGVHSCAGQFLARVEGHAVLSALLSRVSSFELLHAERKLNNVLRGFRSLQVGLR